MCIIVRLGEHELKKYRLVKKWQWFEAVRLHLYHTCSPVFIGYPHLGAETRMGRIIKTHARRHGSNTCTDNSIIHRLLNT